MQAAGGRASSSTAMTWVIAGGTWRNAASAIDIITITPLTGANFVTGSKFVAARTVRAMMGGWGSVGACWRCWPW